MPAVAKRRWVALLSVVLAGGLSVSVFLPWFKLPVFSWVVPAPAWSKAGLACMILATLLVLRAVGGPVLRWGVRLGVLPAFYFWWTSLEHTKAWGASHLGKAQLQFSSVNRALSTLGSETIEIYNPTRWRALELQQGWYLAGGCLVLTAVLTLFDEARRRRCSSCQNKILPDDRFCSGCGGAQSSLPGCSNCGLVCQSGDKFCRGCGSVTS